MQSDSVFSSVGASPMKTFIKKFSSTNSGYKPLPLRIRQPDKNESALESPLSEGDSDSDKEISIFLILVDLRTFQTCTRFQIKLVANDASSSIFMAQVTHSEKHLTENNMITWYLLMVPIKSVKSVERNCQKTSKVISVHQKQFNILYDLKSCPLGSLF